MLDRVLVAIRSARPGMTLRARAVIEAVVLSKGSIGSAETVARALGLQSRFRLARLLEHEGLPPLHRLTEWVTVLNWLACAERAHVSLCWLAFRGHRHPSACYRLVKKVTGHRWEDVQARGSQWALLQFLKELRVWGRRRRWRGAQNVLVDATIGVYRKRPDAERLREVSDHSRAGRFRYSPVSGRTRAHPR